MPLYEIINPSDKYTMRAENHEVAAIAGLFVGEGRYPLDEIDGDFRLPAFFTGDANVWFKETFNRSLDDSIPANALLVADALESVMIGSVATRRATEDALAFITEPEQKAAYLSKQHDERRTSLNDIGGYAQQLAESIRAKVAADKRAETVGA